LARRRLLGYRRGTRGVQPLILDSVVAGRLPSGLVTPPTQRNRFPNWRSEEWGRYVTWARDRAGGHEPDSVELALFTGALDLSGSRGSG
jgi:hypothetical protein